MVLLCVSVILIFVGLRSVDDVKNILIGIATNLVGIAVTVSFVQYFLDRQDETKAKEEEKKDILRHHQILAVLIGNYVVYYNNIVTPFSERAKIDPFTLKIQFKFSDLQDLYKQSLLMKDKMYRPSIEAFYDAEKRLREYCISCINNVEYKYYPQIQKPILEFIKKSLQYDVSDSILGNQTITGSKEKLTDTIQKYIADESEDWVGKFDRDELGPNMMIPYVLLFKLLQSEAACIVEYFEEIKKIAGDPQ